MTTPIDKQELKALRRMVARLEEDLHGRAAADAETAAQLRAAWEDARERGRTGMSQTEWLEQYLTQVAVAWVLTGVFVRYLEDNGFIAPAIVGWSDPGMSAVEAVEIARERQRLYFRQDDHGAHSDTDYLLSLFAELARERAGELFTARRNPLHRLRISGDGASALIDFFRELHPDTNDLVRHYRAEAGEEDDTRFLGDLYQDLSESARKQFALLQTPDFVEAFILDHTLEPAIERFGLDAVRFIDPTCGSGHFLLGGFRRLWRQKAAARPGERPDVLVREALEATHGVDINPFAVAISRFRLLMAAFKLSGVTRWTHAPDFPLHVAVGDSLILGSHFPRFDEAAQLQAQLELDRHRWDSRYSTDDNDLIFGTPSTPDTPGKPGILTQQYHAVVGNPPYITPKDPGLRDTYRLHYMTCYRSYALVCPFIERFFELALGDSFTVAQDRRTALRRGVASPPDPGAGFVGAIVANSFMKRSFGKKLIESYLGGVDLTHIVDTSGAYIPGHGTPTVILFGRNQDPQRDSVFALMGIRGEPSTPREPSEGLVWQSIIEGMDDEDFENEYASTSMLERTLIPKHPWSLQGGGALGVKTSIESSANETLNDNCNSIGFQQDTHADEAFVFDVATLKRYGVKSWKKQSRGSDVRDWSLHSNEGIIFPFDNSLCLWQGIPRQEGWDLFIRLRVFLSKRKAFGGGTYLDQGKEWFDYHQFPKDRYGGLTTSFAEVATHNHFVLDRGGKVFNRTAPVIKLPADKTEDDHLELLGLLNSSVACFWLKQVAFNKGYGADAKGARTRNEPDEDFYQFDSTKMKQFPVADEKPLEIARELDQLGQTLSQTAPSEVLSRYSVDELDRNQRIEAQTRGLMIALQEELDWTCYRLYGLFGKPPVAEPAQREHLPEVALGERAFEIVLARKVARGEVQTSWFERHGSTPITEVPARWPQWYRALVEERIALIAGDPDTGRKPVKALRLIEKPKYKRRWRQASWEDRERKALEAWLGARLEAPAYFPQADRDGPGAQEPPRLVRVQDLADAARKDEAFMKAAVRYAGDSAVNVEKLVEALVMDRAVPYLPTQRYKASGLKRRREWERTWDAQRVEDAIDARTTLDEGDGRYLDEAAAARLKAQAVGAFGAPPKYRQSDFLKGDVYRLRGKLDVGREAFVHFPGVELEDGSPVVAWAGLDHKQRVMALVSWYNEGKMSHGWSDAQRKEMLAGVLDLLPWVRQWHPEPDPYTGQPLDETLLGFVEMEARDLGEGLEALEAVRLGDAALLAVTLGEAPKAAATLVEG